MLREFVTSTAGHIKIRDARSVELLTHNIMIHIQCKLRRLVRRSVLFLASIKAILCGAKEHPAQPINFDRMYAVICEIENGDPKKLGGRPCIGRALWEQYAKATHGFVIVTLDYGLSNDEDFCRVVSMKAIRGLAKELTCHHIPVTPGNIYHAWRFGFDGFLKHYREGWHYQGADYAENLYNDKEFRK